ASVAVRNHTIERQALGEVGHEAAHAMGEDLGGDHVGVPVPGGGVGEVHEVRVESALVERVGPAGGVGHEEVVRGGLGQQVAGGRGGLAGRVHEERVDVGGHGDPLGREVGDEVGPA